MAQTLPTSGDSGISEPVIIQCPECQTKFSIDSAALLGIDAPKFHCSRCDYLFSNELNRPKTKLQPLKSSSKSSMQLEIPRSLDSSFRAEPPQERELPHGSQIPFNFSSQKNAADDLLQETSPSEDLIKFDDFGLIKNTPLTDEPLSHSIRENHLLQNISRNISGSRESVISDRFAIEGSWKLIWVPVIAAVLLLVALNLTLFFSADFAKSFRESFFANSVHAPPQEVFIRGAKIKRVVLDGGEVAQVISGTVVNRNENPFREVTFEGNIFDSRGKLIASKQTKAGNGLARARFKSLTPEMITSMQSNNSKRVTLRPGESQDFAIAFLGKQITNSRYFTVRVYSVKG